MNSIWRKIMSNEEVIKSITEKIEEYVMKNFTEIKINSTKSRDTIELMIEMELKKNDL